ncbi:hypothetical protein CBR_g47155 [Chara braunii]|uniref:Uncharacterized protein n=1 Tax=Chara braunii TaxID=69332 RepID=A0A388M1N9_CHABU|nr:hypothetical protein CBR_g47155 [Chara braunii]|eukprot:GBG88456.1 hypothetical protein CBR_g47155 [Chara braunii]
MSVLRIIAIEDSETEMFMERTVTDMVTLKNEVCALNMLIGIVDVHLQPLLKEPELPSAELGWSTSPYTVEQEAKAAARLKERREKKEAKKKALLEEQAAKLKKIEEEMVRERERLKREEEEKLKAVEEEEEEDEQLQERRRAGGRGESSGTKEDQMEKKITEWVAGLSLGKEEEALMYVPREEQEAAMRAWDAEEDPLKRQAMEDEKRMEWKFRLMRERKRRMDAASEAAKELEEVKKQRDQMATQVDLLGKMEVMAKNIERLARVQEEQYLFGRDMAARIRSDRHGSSNDSLSSTNGAILLAPLLGGNTASSSKAIVPYQEPQSMNYGGNERSYNGGYNNNRGNNGGYNGVEVVEESPPEAPSRGKQKAELQTNAMYMPKDMDGLYKAYKEALAVKEMALREAECLKERMVNASASKIQMSLRKSVAAKRTTPRNLKTTLDFVDIDSDDEKEGEENMQKEGKIGGIVDVAHELEKTKLQSFREKRMKELRSGKKHDLEETSQIRGNFIHQARPGENGHR